MQGGGATAPDYKIGGNTPLLGGWEEFGGQAGRGSGKAAERGGG